MLVIAQTNQTVASRPEEDYYDTNYRRVQPEHANWLFDQHPSLFGLAGESSPENRSVENGVRCGYSVLEKGVIFYMSCGGNWTLSVPGGQTVAGGRRHGIPWAAGWLLEDGDKVELLSWRYVESMTPHLPPMETVKTEEEQLALIRRVLMEKGFKTPSEIEEARRLLLAVPKNWVFKKNPGGYRTGRFLAHVNIPALDRDLIAKYWI